MPLKDLNKLQARARILKAMAHPTRLYILNALEQGECCVCELHEKIEGDFSTVSKHLSVLKNAGLVKDEKRGLQVFYTLCCPCVLEFMGCVENVLRANAAQQKDAAS